MISKIFQNSVMPCLLTIKQDPGIPALTNHLYPSKVHAMLGGDERELLSDLGVQDGEIPLTCSELWTDAVRLNN